LWRGNPLFGSRRAKPGFAGDSLCCQAVFWKDWEMAISRDEVLHVARLARLALTEEEVERFQQQLSAILEAVGKVSELDLSGVEPTSHPLEVSNVWADDEPRPSLPVDEALANAPDREGNYFRVPPA
jgi:aspartyl-tRNA(Asn)/glutamyl-tRNA(Gln) amidotransferase subunit C